MGDQSLIKSGHHEFADQKEVMKMDAEETTRRIQLWGLVGTILMGLAFHEVYKMSGFTPLGLISPVNESKWEHWKMAYTPMLILGAVEYARLRRIPGKRWPNYLTALAAGILVFQVSTFGLIELWELAIGESHLPVHMATFLLGAGLGHGVKYRLLRQKESSRIFSQLGLVLLILQLALFAWFTFDPPRLDYFRDSLTATYGIHGLR